MKALPLINLSTTFRGITPAWTGGAQQRAELRAPVLKGLLRFWYRAIDPHFMSRGSPDGPSPEASDTWEDLIFGSSGDLGGRSSILLDIEPVPIETLRWKDLRVERFRQGSGRNVRNGPVYLGYPFQMRGNEDRDALAPGFEFALRCHYLPTVGAQGEQHIRRGLLAAIWLLGALGGMGTRSRRGFGSLCLTGWSLDAPRLNLLKRYPRLGEVTGIDREGDQERLDTWQKDLKMLPLSTNAKTPGEWNEIHQQGLQTLTEWFPEGFDRAEHPHRGDKFQVVLVQKGFSTWDEALNHLGRSFQEFRVRRSPDYELVKDHVKFSSRQGGQPLRRAPERTVFGLPLTFRYSSLSGARPVTLVPFNENDTRPFDRHPSLLLFKIVPIGNRFHPLVVRMDGPVPGHDPPPTVFPRNQRLDRASGDLIDAFLSSLTEGAS